MTDTVTITLSVQDANELISAASTVLSQLDHALENGEHISLAWKHLDEARRCRLYGAARSLRHNAWKAAQK